jgi:hypothetical protein
MRQKETFRPWAKTPPNPFQYSNQLAIGGPGVAGPPRRLGLTRVRETHISAPGVVQIEREFEIFSMPVGGALNNKGGCDMFIKTVEDLKKRRPDLYAEVFAIGHQRGLDMVRQGAVFEHHVLLNVSQGSTPNVAFAKALREHPTAAKSYFLRLRAGEPDILKNLEEKK